MLAGLAVALVLSSPVPLPKPVAPPMAAAVPSDAAPVVGGAAGAAAPARTVAALSAPTVPVPLARPVAAGAGPASEGASSREGPSGASAAAGAGPRAEDGTASMAAPREIPSAGLDPAEAATAPATIAAESATAAPVPLPLPRPVAPAATGLTPAAGGTAEARAAAAGAPRPAPQRRVADAPVVRAMLAVPGYAAPRDMVCRDPRISGQPAATFAGHIPGCGILDPVRVASIAGVRLSEPATLDCRTARKFADWLSGIAQPAARETLGSGIASVRIMGSYACRTRNNRAGERLSEHSVGRAVDVGGVTLADGRRIAVRDDWGRGASGAFLRRAAEGACGGFTTVIGPDGDRHHHDHLHLDAAYRDSTWCR